MIRKALLLKHPIFIRATCKLSGVSFSSSCFEITALPPFLFIWNLMFWECFMCVFLLSMFIEEGEEGEEEEAKEDETAFTMLGESRPTSKMQFSMYSK